MMRKRLLRWIDRPERPGWVVFGPDGVALAWAPFEAAARLVQRYVARAHDHARCGDGW